MKAVLDYGGFIKEIEVSDMREIIYMVKPQEKLGVRNNERVSLTEITDKKLEFYLKEAPQIGKPLMYEFVKES